MRYIGTTSIFGHFKVKKSLMKIKLFFVALCLFYAASAQDTEKIRLQVRVINGMDGAEIKNASIKVTYARTDNNVPLKTEKKSSFYEVVKGTDLKVRAEAAQYYTEEKRFETETLYDQDVLELKLIPKPTAAVAETAPPPVAEPAPFFIIVQDIVSGDKVNAQVEVTAPSGRKENVTSGQPYQPKEKGEYNFTFKKEGFGSYSQKQNTRLSSDLQLIPVTFEVRTVAAENFSEHEYALIDAQTRQPVMKSQLFILDENKKPVETLFNSSKGTYLTYKINPQKTYTAEVKAEGYEPLTAPLNNTSRNITLELTPADLEKVTLAVQDAYTRESLAIRQLKIFTSARTEIRVEEQNGEYSALLNPRRAYQVEFEADGYSPVNRPVEARDFQGDKLEFLLRKPLYPLALQIQNELTEEQQKAASATVNPAGGSVLAVNFDPPTNSFLLESDPDETLQISITVPGFRPYIASNNRKQLAQFQLKVQLEPEIVSAPAVTETAPVTIPPVTEAAPPVVTPPVTATAQPVEVPKPAPKEDVPMEAKKGRRYALNGVNFEQSQTTMLKGSETKLQEVLKFMTENPKISIEVIGHTDKTGDERQNQRLSEFRARAVANWLFNNGINPDRIQTSGKGSSEPVSDNQTEEGKAQNRRIEILVVEE